MRERRRDVGDRHKHRAGKAHAGKPEPEGPGIEPLHVEPDDGGAGEIVGAGADRCADPGEAEESEECRRDHERDARNDDPDLVDDQRTDEVAVERVGQVDRPRVRPEAHQLQVEDDHRHRDQQDELLVLGAADEAVDDRALQRVADREKDRRDRQRGDDRVDPQGREGEIGHVHREHRELAMGEIHDMDDTEDHRQPTHEKNNKKVAILVVYIYNLCCHWQFRSQL